MTETPKMEARRRWVQGEAEASIAEKLGVDVGTIEGWRDEHEWAGLRDLIDARAAAAHQSEADDADGFAFMLVNALDQVIASAMKRGVSNASAQDVHRLASALKVSREVREDVRLSRLDRELRKQL